MNRCDICGRKTNRIYRLEGYALCSKHMHQLYSHGKFLDTTRRTNNDLNDYKVQGEITTFFLYNQKNKQVGSFLIDTEDLQKVKFHKWRLSHSHAVTGLPAKGTQRDVSHVVMDFMAKDNPGLVVDHINGNPLDNRKLNLRICSQQNNTMNKSFMSNNTSGFIGVSYKKDRNRWDPAIRSGQTRCHLGMTKDFEEAVYKRFIAEELIFRDFANNAEHKRKEEFCKDLPDKHKRELEDIVKNKLREKNLWQ